SRSDVSSGPLAAYLRHLEVDVAGLLEDPIGAAHRPRTPALERGSLVDGHLGDDQVVDVDVAPVFRVGDGGHQQLEELLGAGLVQETKVVDRPRDLLAADQVGDDPRLARGNARVTEACDGHGYLGITSCRTCGRRSGRGSYGSGRTRRACGRPCSR